MVKKVKKRGSETAYDMLLSIGAVMVVVVILLVVTWRPKQQYGQNVDYEGAIALAVSTSAWPIYVPDEIPTGLKITSARFESESYGELGDSRWYLGFTGLSSEFISLWQSDGILAKVKLAATNNGLCEDTVFIAGQIWEKCESNKPLTRSLVKQEDEVITVISGTVSWQELQEFTKSLIVAK